MNTDPPGSWLHVSSARFSGRPVFRRVEPRVWGLHRLWVYVQAGWRA